MRIAIAGFVHESNTFNPLLTDRAAFIAQNLTSGAALLDEWHDAHHEVCGVRSERPAVPFDVRPQVCWMERVALCRRSV